MTRLHGVVSPSYSPLGLVPYQSSNRSRLKPIVVEHLPLPQDTLALRLRRKHGHGVFHLPHWTKLFLGLSSSCHGMRLCLVLFLRFSLQLTSLIARHYYFDTLHGLTTISPNSETTAFISCDARHQLNIPRGTLISG